MLCGNALVLRYRVRIKQRSGPTLPTAFVTGNGYVQLSQITKVDGLRLGDTEMEKMREQGKTFELNTGYREVQPITIVARLEATISAEAMLEFLEDWYADRMVTCDVFIDLCDRGWCVWRTYEYLGSSCTGDGFSSALAIGNPVVGEFSFRVSPYDVLKRKPLDARLRGIVLGQT